MNLCDSGHEEVCYDGRKCPACKEAENAASLQDEIDKLNDKISELENGG